MTLDSFGIAGMAIDIAFILMVSGGAVIFFIYFWVNDRLDMDEEPKHQMMEEDLNDRRK